MAKLNDKKINGESIGKNPNYITVEYDFANDGGVVDAYESLELDSSCVVELDHVYVEEEVTSAGAATIDVGVAGKLFIAAEAIASFVANAVIKPNKSFHYAIGEIASVEVKVAALTAGKFRLVYKILKA